MNNVKILSLSNGQFVPLSDYMKLDAVITDIDRLVQSIIENPVNNADKNNVCGIYEILQKYRKVDKSK